MTSSFRKPLTLKRFVAGAYVNGRWIEGASTPSTIQASVQPPTPDDMLLLPEGRRRQAEFLLFTDTKLLTADSNTGINADEITINGEQYEVIGIWEWQNNVINHFKVIVGRVKG